MPQQYVGPNAVYASGLTCLQQIIPAYVYQQFADDDNIQAFTMAQNAYATQFLLWFNTLNLPIYTGGIVAGQLLDWVGVGLYGIPRPSISVGSVTSVAAINSYPINTIAINARRVRSSGTLQSINDDIYRRVITWNFYKGDGFVFCVEWLKRRVFRFLNGPNGISPVIDNTYSVSVTESGTDFTITVPTADPTNVSLLNSLINSGACITPFQYSFTVSTVAGATGLANDGGVLQVLITSGWPTSPSGLLAGQVWDNGTTVSVIPGVVPNPFAPPVFFGLITSAALLALGGGNLPLSNPGIGTNRLWNNGGLVCVA